MNKIKTKITIVSNEDDWHDEEDIIFELNDAGKNKTEKQLSGMMKRATNEMLVYVDDIETYEEYVEDCCEFDDMDDSVLNKQELFKVLSEAVEEMGHSVKCAAEYISKKFGWKYEVFKTDIEIFIRD